MQKARAAIVVRAGRERAKRALVARQMRELVMGWKGRCHFSHLQIVPLFRDACDGRRYDTSLDVWRPSIVLESRERRPCPTTSGGWARGAPVALTLTALAPEFPRFGCNSSLCLVSLLTSTSTPIMKVSHGSLRNVPPRPSPCPSQRTHVDRPSPSCNRANACRQGDKTSNALWKVARQDPADLRTISPVSGPARAHVLIVHRHSILTT